MAEAGKADTARAVAAHQATHAQPLLGLALRRASAQGRKRALAVAATTAVSAGP